MQITLACLFVLAVAVFAAENPKPNEKRDKRGLYPFGYAAGYPYVPAPYAAAPYAAAPYAAYPYAYAPAGYAAYGNPYAFSGLASPIVAAPAPFAYFG